MDTFQFLNSSLESLIKNLDKDDFKYLGQEFDNKVVDLVKQKKILSLEYMRKFKKFKE